jgi:hypothetical protein
MWPFSRFFIVAALALAVSGCANPFKKKDPLPCPSAAIVKDASRKVVFRPGPGRDVTDIVVEARLPRILVSCEYNDRGVEVTTVVNIIAARGPADTTRRANIRYFVAVINPQTQIIGKREFESELRFPINIDRGFTSEELVQMIPVGKGVAADGYAIAVGFQLTREELEANRRGNSASLISPAGVQPSLPAPSAPAEEAFPQPRSPGFQ